MLDIRNCDCMDLMKEFPDKYFDLAVVDPPYGIGDFRRNKSRIMHKKIQWNDLIPSADYFNCFQPCGALIWYKKHGACTISQCEIASLSFQKKVDFIEIPLMTGCCDRIGRIHPCQKPVELYNWVFKKYAAPGVKIIDTHLGSASVAISCYYENLDLTACEIDKEYYAAAMKRIEQETKQLRLI